MSIRKTIKHWLRRRGYEVRKLGAGECDDLSRLVRLAHTYGLSIFLDVGANAGYFGIDLRHAGYRGRIISFEPLSAAYGALQQQASRDRNWTVAPRGALGHTPGREAINIAGNSYSSSLLPMTARHNETAPESRYVNIENIDVRRLDDVLAELDIAPEVPLALKIDTQGFEAQVLDGALRTLPRVKLLFLEMSLVPLYEGAPDFDALYARLRADGYRCVALSHEFSDPVTGEMLQLNGTFVRG